jgi:hypothetical protein
MRSTLMIISALSDIPVSHLQSFPPSWCSVLRGLCSKTYKLEVASTIASRASSSTDGYGASVAFCEPPGVVLARRKESRWPLAASIAAQLGSDLVQRHCAEKPMRVRLTDHSEKAPRPCPCSTPQKSCGQPLGEGWPRAIRSGTGRGGDVTGSRVLLFRCRYGRALAVETAGRASPSATQTFGSLCDCRLTKR